MPCYDPTNYEAERASQKVNELTNMLCELCKTLNESELPLNSLMSEELAEWWKQHKKVDQDK